MSIPHTYPVYSIGTSEEEWYEHRKENKESLEE